jgi:hypothetical protein
MLTRPRIALTLLAALFLLALPAVASAAVYEVNSTADEEDLLSNGICLTLGGNCTLRAAIEESKLDGKPFKSCRSPKTYKKLKSGKHVFKVRATDRAGNVDPTPAKRKFTVLG